MNRAAMSVGKAQLLLGRLIGLAVAITLFFTFALALGSGGSDIAGSLLVLLLLCIAPPAAVLGLLFVGQRRLASYVSLLGTVPCTALFVLMLLPLASFGWSSIWRLENVLFALPFLYTAVTLARVGVGVRITDGERRQARQLRAARRAGAPAIGPTEEHQELSAIPRQ
jgi:hypothetical protein